MLEKRQITERVEFTVAEQSMLHGDVDTSDPSVFEDKKM